MKNFFWIIIFLSFLLTSCTTINEQEHVKKELEQAKASLSKQDSRIDELINWFNEEFTILEGSDEMNYWDFTYWDKEGTVNDIYRLFVNMMRQGKYEATILVYETEEGLTAVAVYREEEPRYLYYDDGFKSKHHGYSFRDLIKAEEKRINKEITRYGVITETRTFRPIKINIKDVEEWINT